MNWVLITVVAIISRAFYSISTKALSSRVKLHEHTQSVILPFVGAVLALLLIPWFGFNLQGLGQYWWLALLVGFTQGLGNIVYFYGQKYIDSGTTQVALSSKLVWSALLAVIFLGSKFSFVQIAGMVLLMLGVILVQQLGKKNKDIRKGMLLIGVSAVIFAVFAIAGAKLSKGVNPVVYLLVTYLGACVFASIIGFKDVARDLPYIKQNLNTVAKYFTYAAATSTVYFTLVYFAYRKAPDAGVVAVLVNAQVVTTVLLATVLLKERDHLPRKLIAGLLVVLSSYLIVSP